MNNSLVSLHNTSLVYEVIKIECDRTFNLLIMKQVRVMRAERLLDVF